MVIFGGPRRYQKKSGVVIATSRRRDEQGGFFCKNLRNLKFAYNLSFSSFPIFSIVTVLAFGTKKTTFITQIGEHEFYFSVQSDSRYHSLPSLDFR